MSGELMLGMALAYLLGSFPSAYVVARLVAGVDIRTVGDGNVGAKNVYHQAGLIPAAVVAVADAGKGTLTVLLAQQLALSELASFLMGLAAVLGHDWPLFLRFRGGQGQATSVGVLLVLMPRETIIGLAVTGVVLWRTDHWDLSNGIGFALMPLLAWWSGRPSRQVLYFVALFPTIGLRKMLGMPTARRLAAARKLEEQEADVVLPLPVGTKR
ncbi:MAG: glycerol-3-phosphate acyltransferase [Anaerolineae bacterium]